MKRLFLHIALYSFTVLLICHTCLLQAQSVPAPQARKPYSVLANGSSLKVSVTEDRVYKVSYEQLLEQGLLSEPISSQRLAVWGNISGPLPFYNTPDIYDDLQHLPIKISDGNDGTFGPGDFLLFYGESQHRWTYSPSESTYTYSRHPFCDQTYYFIGIHAEYTSSPIIESCSSAPQTNITTSDEHIHYEKDLNNLCSGGTLWLGESFSFTNDSRTFTVPTPGAGPQTQAQLEIQTASMTGGGSASFTVTCNGRSLTINHPSTSSSNCSDLKAKNYEVSLSGESTQVTLKYSKSASASNGYLDWIHLFYERPLQLENGYISFRNSRSIGKSCSFTISGTSEETLVWNVTDIYRISCPEISSASGSVHFSTDPKDTLQEYIAFNPSQCPSPVFEGLVAEQNLHALKDISYIIVTHPDFVVQANQIANIHTQRSGHRCWVATTTQIYNEYSSGAKDPSSIRLFLRNLKENSGEGSGPENLMLFGAASYDYKNILGSVTDFVPTFQSLMNKSEAGGDPLEDNFAYLDDNEGISPVNNSSSGKMDIGVGRIPVRNTEEANAAVEKIDIYSSTVPLATKNINQSGNFGHWRNDIVYVTDDGFESSMESTIVSNDNIQNNYPAFHLEKLYSDSYQRNSTSTSNRVDALSKAIQGKIENGCLFMGYLGHSGWDSWSDEKILTNEIINNLKESYSFPIVMASSCSFGHFDNINQISGAELLVTNRNSGSIAVIATARTAYTGSIEEILKRFAEELASTPSGVQPTLGEIFLKAKVSNRQSAGYRFVLLGDPGVRVPIAQYSVVTTHINGKNADDPEIDTLKALRPVSIEGCIQDAKGNVIQDFNGTLSVRIYDKVSSKTTLGLYNPIDRGGSDDPYNPKVTYNEQNSLIFQGTAPIRNGQYSFSFIVPKDISYNFGNGRINYYAYSEENRDAKGSFDDIIVGGFYEQAVIDTTPPVVKLYIDNNSYLPGTVGRNPNLYAEISDKNGINTTGTGIGHDMTLIIDNDENNPISVNQLFSYNLGSYREGTLTYPLELEPGRHTASLKVWNIHNISTTATIHFNVDGSDKISMFDVRAVPNPCRGEYTDFYFNHNGEQGDIEECHLKIFNLQGMLIAQRQFDLKDLSGYAIGPLRWDLCNDRGSKVQSGMYICHLYVRTSNGANTHKTCKVVVIKP